MGFRQGKILLGWLLLLHVILLRRVRWDGGTCFQPVLPVRGCFGLDMRQSYQLMHLHVSECHVPKSVILVLLMLLARLWGSLATVLVDCFS